MVSFSRCVLLAALASLVGVSHAATVTITSYSSATSAPCQGTASGTPTTYETGKCQTSGSASYAYFCDSQYQYTVSYSDAACTTAKATDISAAPIDVCSQTIYSDESKPYSSRVITCVNPTDGVQMPLSFPPSGWALENNYVNLTRVSGEDTEDRVIPCTDTEGFANRPFATAPGCRISNNGNSGSYQYLGNSKFFGTVYYSDSACSVYSYASLNPYNCSQGESLATAGDLESDFSFLPTSLVQLQYAEDDCTGDITSYSLLQTTCASYSGYGSQHSCSANSSLAISQSYSTSNCTNAPFSTQTYPAAAGIQEDQTKYSKDTCDSGRRYVCGFTAAEQFGSPASVASVSIASIVLLAVAALFGRQL